MRITTAVDAMSALAHESRLDLFRRLVKAGPEGLAVGALVKASGLNFSTVSAQLLILANNRLVRKDRQGRSVVYSANYNTMQRLITFLMKDCCQGNANITAPLVGLTGNASATPCDQGECK